MKLRRTPLVTVAETRRDARVERRLDNDDNGTRTGSDFAVALSDAADAFSEVGAGAGP